MNHLARRVAAQWLEASLSREACIVAAGSFGESTVLFKNRDRNYEPKLKVHHALREGLEVLWIEDLVTGWVEGINEAGIGLVNSALQVGRDEAEKRLVTEVGRKSKDSERVLKALEKDNLEEALEVACTYKGGIKGHTLISDGVTTMSLEQTRKHECVVRTLRPDRLHVRTNHGFYYDDAGYREGGDDYLSSVSRRDQAQKALRMVEEPSEVAPAVYGARKGPLDSPNNMVRDTKKMRTTSQMVLDLTEGRLLLYLIPGKVKWAGYENRLPKSYEPKLRLELFEYTDLDGDGQFEVRKKEP